ncbi:hypothetical protein PHYPSEUDO_013028 [Phytophthora pseudosyringae]|uniref:Elicitin n=1 Tax=Phytophthora pseudosyringae TaxID=221518 RepID=A0A8T1V6G7_9STRA|nr:hypothetical protein PHYPSEUDO_013028 [Phytophthora pseudosyringae]
MKPVVFLSLVIATMDATLAAECTTDDLTTISNVYAAAMSDGTSACPDLTMASDTTDYCSYTDCLGYMSSMLDDLPDCSSGGVSIKDAVQATIDYCETGTADTSDVLTGSASSSSSLLRSGSSTTPTTESTTSDKVTSSTVPPATGGSSSASSISMALSSAGIAVSALLFTVGP